MLVRRELDRAARQDPREQLRGAVERLKSVDARVVGAVLSTTKGREGDGYGYGYGYAPEPGRSSGEPEPLRTDQAMPTHRSPDPR